MPGCTGEADPGLRDSYYQRDGTGHFTDIAQRLGLDRQLSPWGGTDGRFADLNGDGLRDFYATAFLAPSRLFLNTGDGGLMEVPGGDAAIDGEKYGAAIGDIDNDGDLDIFAISGGDVTQDRVFRSILLLNLGQAAFLDITATSGLPASLLAANALGAAFADLDNDGDLDLVTATPHTLNLNRGDGSFEDGTASSGIVDVGNSVSVADWNGDGQLDLVFGLGGQVRGESVEPGGLFANRGNENHWLRVQLVGVRSNRGGIGARVRVQAGAGRWQLRELEGGTGKSQDEGTVHFGLGSTTEVDSLEVRWPSGQRDVMIRIPGDQEIRIVEGRGEWYPVARSAWVQAPPASVSRDQRVELAAVVRPALFEPSALIRSVTADLSSLGGAIAIPLADQGDGTYRLQTALRVGGDGVAGLVDIAVEQQTSLGLYWVGMTRDVLIDSATTTAVVELATAPRGPGQLYLAESYPNPFNASTSIRFQVPVRTAVDLAVYDPAGQRVATLLHSVRDAGSYTVQWDGRHNSGLQLASGVYFCRLTTASGAATAKLLLLR